MNVRHMARSGLIAGAVSGLVFVAIHDLLISDIWFSVLPVTIAGAVCGASVAWSYGLMFDGPTIGTWVRYNLVYDVMFFLLGAASLALLEPVTSIAALIEANEMPKDLIAQAMPLTVGFTLAMWIVLSLLYAKNWLHRLSILATVLLLVLLLGLNVSVIGLVIIPIESSYLIAELLGLILAINVVYVVVFIVLARRHFKPETE